MRGAPDRARRRAEGSALRVLQSTPPPGEGTNPYVVQLHEALLGAGVTVLPFSWRAALTGRYDVVHTHWPEILVWGSTPVRRLVRQLLTLLLVARLTVLRVPVVRTLHNLAPHEPVHGLRGRVLALLESRERWWVRLSTTTPTPDERRTSTILLGHFRDWFAEHPRSPSRPDVVVVPGVIRAYKGLDELAAAVPLLQRPGVVVHVVGRVVDQQLADRLADVAAREPRLRVTLRHVSDAELVAAVTEAQLVALPYRSMHNSAALLLALSLDRPALVPASPTTQELADEVGPGWVRRADLSTPQRLAAALDEALLTTSGAPPGPPDLSRRDWSEAGRLHVLAYRAALAGRRRPAVEATA